MPDTPLHAALARAIAAVLWTPVSRPDDADAAAGLPYATHAGVLELPEFGRLRCYQLNTGERVFDAEDVERLLGLPDAEAS